MKTWIFRMRAYFLRGFGSWITFILSAVQFIIIVYKLAVSSVPALDFWFPSLWFFAFVLILLGVPLCVIIGFVDYKHGTAPAEYTVTSMASPWNVDFAKALSLLCEGKNAEAQAVLRKWIQ